LKNLAIKKNYYIVIFEITQLINNKKRAQRVYRIIVNFINKIIVQKSTISQHAFNNKISRIKNIKKKKHKLKKKKDFKK